MNFSGYGLQERPELWTVTWNSPPSPLSCHQPDLSSYHETTITTLRDHLFVTNPVVHFAALSRPQPSLLTNCFRRLFVVLILRRNTWHSSLPESCVYADVRHGVPTLFQTETRTKPARSQGVVDPVLDLFLGPSHLLDSVSRFTFCDVSLVSIGVTLSGHAGQMLSSHDDTRTVRTFGR
jgi:hypothetical protein